MKSSFVPALVFVTLAFAGTARADDACVDGRVARLACHVMGKVLTSFGCHQEFGVRCLEASAIPAGEVRTWGGFRRVPLSESVLLYRDGRVTKVVSEADLPPVVTEALTVDAARMARILELFSKTRPGTLWVDESQPECMDAPMTSYAIYQLDGSTSTKVEVGAQRGCRPYYSNGEGAYASRGILEGLANFVRFLE